MRGRLLILVGLVILVIVIAVIFLSGALNPPKPPATTAAGTPGTPVANNNQPPAGPTPTPIRLVNIVIALQNLPRGYQFPTTTDKLQDVATYVLWPEEAVPFNALKESDGGLEKLLGKIARTEMFREQPILMTLLTDNLTELADYGSDAAAVIPSDRQAIAIPIDRFTSVAYAVRPGDSVDIIISLLFVDVDEVFQSLAPNKITLLTRNEEGKWESGESIEGRTELLGLGDAIISPSERPRPRLVTQRAIQDAQVIWVGDFPLVGNYIGVVPTPTPVPKDTEDSGGGGTPPPPPTPVPPPDILTLAVSPQEATFLAYAIDANIPLRLTLRSATDTSRASSEPVTLDYIMNTFRITLPSRRDYALEPAVRSVRQIIAGNQISLDTGTTTTSP